MPYYRVERTMKPVVFYVEADTEEERDNILSEIYSDPHVVGQIGDWELENMGEYVSDESYDGFNEDQDWAVFWDEADERYYWK